MEYKIIISGFGGQGVLFLGKILAQAAFRSGYETSWLPSYGPEMRGGTANCRVVISDTQISSPAFNKADAVIAMNRPSLSKFSDCTDKLVITDMANLPFEYGGECIEGIDISKTAPGEKYANLTNMLMLGVWMKHTDILSLDVLKEAIETVAGKNGAAIDIEAMEYGMKLI